MACIHVACSPPMIRKPTAPVTKVAETRMAATNNRYRSAERSRTGLRLHVGGVRRGPRRLASLEERNRFLNARAVRVAHRERPTLVCGRACILTLFVDRV